MSIERDLFGLLRDRDYANEGPRIDIYAIIEAGRAAGAAEPNPYRRGTFEHSLYEDGRKMNKSERIDRCYGEKDMSAHDPAEHALAQCRAVGLHPLRHPLGDAHHTDAPFTGEDEAIGAAVAFFLGGIFVDTSADYFYREMTSLDIWRRVARALRIHGLQLADRDTQIFLPR